jgi:hypothetical protein
MSNEYLRAFVIGSSFFIIFPFFFAVSQFEKNKFNFEYVDYTFLAPIYLGLMNVFSLYIAKTFHLTKQLRFLYTSLFSPTVIVLTVYYFNIYNYTLYEWIDHIIKLYLFYFIIVNFILFLLDTYV